MTEAHDRPQEENVVAAQKRRMAETFIGALRSRDRHALESILAPDVVWSLPGTSLVSGEAQGVEGILRRAETLARYNVRIEIQHVVFGLFDVGLLLHNVGDHQGQALNEHLTTILRLDGQRVSRLDTYISDVPMLNAYFV